MPKTKKKDLNKVKYVSAADFYKNIDDIVSLDGKLEYATRYILNHDMGATHDYAFSGIVNLARQKIAEAINRKPNKDVSQAAKMFLGNPAGYIKGEAEKLANEIDNADINFQGDEELKENCKNIAGKMNEEFNAEVFEVDNNSKSLGVRSRLEASFGGRKGLEEVLNATKPQGWFKKMFSSDSTEWKKLQEAYEEFHHPHSENSGNFSFLNNAAINYLQHKFPGWGPKQEIPVGAYSKLNDSELAKVNFSIGVMNAVKDQYKVDEAFHSLVDENKGIDIKYEDLPEKENNVIDLDDDVEFQNQLKDDVAFENDKSVKVVKSNKDVKLDIPLENEEEEEIDSLNNSIN